MDKTLLTRIYNTKIGDPITFQTFVREGDELDLRFYQVMTRYLEHNSTFGVLSTKDQYLNLMLAWHDLLFLVKEEELGLSKSLQRLDLRSPRQMLTHLFFKVMHGASLEDKVTVLYRWPWHARLMATISSPERFNLEFIINTASMGELETIQASSNLTLTMSQADRNALDVINDDVINYDHLDLLTFAVSENVHTLLYALYHEEYWMRDNRLNYQPRDKHTLNVMAYLINQYDKSPTKDGIKEYIFMTTAYLCFWHFQLTQVQCELWDESKKVNPHGIQLVR